MHSKEGIAMRTLLTLGAIVTAMLVPWSSLAPTWLPDAAGSPVSPSPTQKYTGPAARLNPALGIMPLGRDESRAEPGDSGPVGEFADSRRVVCENGVCRVVDEPVSESTAARSESNTVRHEQRLQSLGATQLRLESAADGDDSRAACLVPVIAGSKVLRRFEASGPTDSDAVTRLVEQIEAWLQDRQ
jgi:hypothetical protein